MPTYAVTIETEITLNFTACYTLGPFNHCTMNQVTCYKRHFLFSELASLSKMAVPKSSPRDAQVMAAILKDMGVQDYEPRCVNQMLEFAYRKWLFLFFAYGSRLISSYVDVMFFTCPAAVITQTYTHMWCKNVKF